MHLKIGTRGSQLALWQTNKVIGEISRFFPEVTCEAVVIKTSGDKIQNQNLYDIGGKGLFLKEIEEAMLSGQIDIAVHSTKDVPGQLPDGLLVDCFLERDDPRDVFVSYKYKTLSDLPKGAVVGTCAPRRIGHLHDIRPDIECVTFRGNVNSRLAKLQNGEVDATILAYAGLHRLGLLPENVEILPADFFIPAVGQGAICVECREDDSKICEILAGINHKGTHAKVSLERQFLIAVDGNCSTPLAAYAENDKKLMVWMASDDFSKSVKERISAEEITAAAKRMKQSVGFVKS